MAAQRGEKIQNVVYPLARKPNSVGRQLLLAQIAEAEKHRKPYIRAAYESEASEKLQRVLTDEFYSKTQIEDRAKLREVIDNLKRKGLVLTVNLLATALLNNNIPLAEALVEEEGISVNEKIYLSNEYEYLIHNAIFSLNSNIIPFLAVHGANVNIYNSNGLTALHTLSFKNKADNTEKLQQLLAVGADPQMPTRDGSFLLHLVAMKNNFKLLDLLMPLGLDINVRDADGNTPLILAASSHATGVVKRLLEAGADPTIKNNEGKTALDFAHEEEYDKIIQLLTPAPVGAPVGPADVPAADAPAPSAPEENGLTGGAHALRRRTRRSAQYQRNGGRGAARPSTHYQSRRRVRRRDN